MGHPWRAITRLVIACSFIAVALGTLVLTGEPDEVQLASTGVSAAVGSELVFVPAPARRTTTEPASAEPGRQSLTAFRSLGPDYALATGERPVPVGVRIPEIGVDADIIELGLNADGVLEVPSDFDMTGWYTGRAVPGDVGPSVVVGHVDSATGPAVFNRLPRLEVGDEIEVDRSDGLVARFRVSAIELVQKDRFPTAAVYGPTEAPTLRLVTCGGAFDRETRSYGANHIVFAEHIGNGPPDPATTTS